MNKKILVAMDFSHVSVNALKYAYAKHPDCEIHIAHASAPVYSPDESFYYTVKLTSPDEIEEELKGVVSKAFDESQIPDNVQIHIIKSDIVPGLKSYIMNNDIDYLYIGSRDKYDFFDKWIGNIALGIIKSVNIPCYLIPVNATYKPYTKVAVASDYHVKDSAMLNWLKAWNADYNAYVNFIHIITGDNNDFDAEQKVIVEELYEQGEVPFSFEISLVKSADISGSLLNSAYEFGADMLIAFPENQSFLGSLLFKSVSKEFILKSDIPVLFYH